MTIDIDAIRKEWLRQCGICDAGLLTECTCPKGDVRAVLDVLCREAEQQRANAALLFGQLEQSRAQVADLADKLHKANAEIASLTTAGTAWANEVAAKDRAIEAVESLLMVTDGDPLGDHGIAIPLGEIRRVVGEARAGVAQ